MIHRRTSIVETHAKTYGWVFQKSSSFYRWLQTGDGLFWISGKAGSGKSTLMKFLASHKEISNLLRAWTHEEDLVVVDFYFWYLDTEMQKSIKGLLQSILFRIIGKRPDLIQIICPQRWERVGNEVDPDTWSDHEFYKAVVLDPNPWTDNELYEAIERAAQATFFVSSGYRNMHACCTKRLPTKTGSENISRYGTAGNPKT